MKNLGYIFILLILILSSGCASLIHKSELEAFNQHYSSGQYIAASNAAMTEEDAEKLDPAELLQSLQAAAALRYAGQYQRSTSLFDQSEVIIKHHNEQMMATDVASNVGSVLANDAVLDYTGREYDGVMVNTYKALNFWQEGKNADARVEFNRALERQRRAKEHFANAIRQVEEALDKKQADNPRIDIRQNINNPEIDSLLQKKYSSLGKFKAYPDFINPFTTYIAGLFFMSEGDGSKAATLLKETYGMVENNSTVRSDLASVEGMVGNQNSQTQYTWVLFENGLGPEKEEFRIDLPIFLLTNKVQYTGIALPKLKFRKQAYPYLTIKSGENQIEKTSILASMDRVIQTEFKQRYPATVARAVTSTLIKTFAQYVAKEVTSAAAGDAWGNIAGLIVAGYQVATTAADIRIWTALPKEFQLAKVKTPESGIITLATPAGAEVNITVPKNSHSLVYVKIPSSEAQIVYDIIKM